MRRLLTIGALAAAAALAQTGGTIAISGSIPGQISITSGGGTTVSATVTIAPLVPGINGTLVGGTADVQIRSNQKYTLTALASVLTTTGAAPDGGNSITADDIGFGINAAVAGGGGANVVTRADTIPAALNYLSTPVGSLTGTNGLTPFHTGQANQGTLKDITGTGVVVITGNRISKAGNLSTSDNYLNVTFGVATLPQYFTPATNFASTITLTAAVI